MMMKPSGSASHIQVDGEPDIELDLHVVQSMTWATLCPPNLKPIGISRLPSKAALQTTH